MVKYLRKAQLLRG